MERTHCVVVFIVEYFLLTVVTFELTETDYRSNEFQLAVNAVVGKDLRIANPVTLLVSPYTVAEAQTLGLAAPPGATAAPDQVFVRPDDNPFSPLYARCESGVT